MTTELMQKLKDAGFPLYPLMADCPILTDMDAEPTLSELIQACPKSIKDGDSEPYNFEYFFTLFSDIVGEWNCGYEYCEDFYGSVGAGKTPEEAVAELWLILKK
jgi:hypothetical protein